MMSEKKNPYAGTQTEKNLQAAFAGESQARNKYTYFASVAKKEGYEQMSALFLKTADNEKEHAKLGLIVTGGSDYHADGRMRTLGKPFFDAAHIEKLLLSLAGSI